MTEQRTLFLQTLNCKKKREGDYIDKRDLKKHFKHTLMFWEISTLVFDEIKKLLLIFKCDNIVAVMKKESSFRIFFLS